MIPAVIPAFLCAIWHDRARYRYQIKIPLGQSSSEQWSAINRGDRNITSVGSCACLTRREYDKNPSFKDSRWREDCVVRVNWTKGQLQCKSALDWMQSRVCQLQGGQPSYLRWSRFSFSIFGKHLSNFKCSVISFRYMRSPVCLLASQETRAALAGPLRRAVAPLEDSNFRRDAEMLVATQQSAEMPISNIRV